MKYSWIIRSVKLRTVLFKLLPLLKLYGLICLAPVAVSLIYGEYVHTLIFAVTAVIAFLVGRFFQKDREGSINVPEGLIITALSYIMFSLLGALGFLPVTSFINGFFESMSGFTTTGLTLFDPETLPRTLVFFRSYSQWIGGAGIVILSLAVLIVPPRSSLRMFLSEGKKDDAIGNIKSLTLLILKVYGTFTVIGAGLFYLSGMGIFDSVVHVLSCISTGGFSSYGKSLAAYGGVTRISFILIMFLGAVNFASYYLLRKKTGIRKFYAEPQLRYLLSVIFISALIYLCFYGWDTQKTLLCLFHSTSASTTTGFIVSTPGEWPGGVKLLSALQMIIGGGDGSTAGGIKVFRFVIIIYLVRWLIRGLLLPRKAKVPLKYADRIIDNESIKRIMGFFALYLMVLTISTVIISLFGYDPSDSFFESASSLGTVGLSSGITSMALPPFLKLVLIFNMWAGRLEILPVLVIFNPFIWRKKEA
ncbi:MAG: hypothetical protein GF409_07550 [Candidatus Omnitrophica bacterium]|nr:hypothetical protein [Candidatus Omnitrophota bacterium]